MIHIIQPRDPQKRDATIWLWAACLVLMMALWASKSQGDEISVLAQGIEDFQAEIQNPQAPEKTGEGWSPDQRFPSKSDPGKSGTPRFAYSAESKNPKAQAESNPQTQRFPRSIMVTCTECGPCNRVKSENPELLGPEPTRPVQWIDYTRTDLSDYGIPPSLISSVPAFVILEAPGVVHKLPTGAICHHAGYKNPEQLRAYLSHSTHNVSLEPWQTETAADPEDCENVCSLRDPEDILSALAGHLARCGGAEAPFVGSIFELSYEGPEGFTENVDHFIRTRTFQRGGLTLTLPPSSSMSRSEIPGGMLVSFSKPVLTTLKKSGFNVEAHLHSVSVTDSGKRYELELRKTPGKWIEIPDLTIVIQ